MTAMSSLPSLSQSKSATPPPLIVSTTYFLSVVECGFVVRPAWRLMSRKAKVAVDEFSIDPADDGFGSAGFCLGFV
jgi:hypothetical protein